MVVSREISSIWMMFWGIQKRNCFDVCPLLRKGTDVAVKNLMAEDVLGFSEDELTGVPRGTKLRVGILTVFVNSSYVFSP